MTLSILFSDDVYLPPCMKCGKCHYGDTYDDRLQRYICDPSAQNQS